MPNQYETPTHVPTRLPKQGSALAVCRVCGTGYWCSPRDLKIRKTCSRRCQRVETVQRHNQIAVAAKNCVRCGAKFVRIPQADEVMWARRKYCSRSCMGAAYQSRMTVPCATCGVEMEAKASRFVHPRGTNRYCSKNCAAKGIELPWAEQLSMAAVTYLKKGKQKEYGSECVICGFARFIEYAHVIPRRNGGSIHPDNIMPLCPNHHRLFDRNRLTEEEKKITDAALARAHASPYSLVSKLKAQ
jgi:endogenous inhibitor of DNA gyrase (YacG/DUF329 family)